MTDQRIKQFQKFISTMEQGEFDALPEKISGNDEISQLGESLIRLSKTLDSKFQHQIKMLKLSQKLNEGVFLNDILEYVYASFHTIIPYNRIGFTLLEKEGKILRAHWSSSDSPNVKLREGFSQPMKGSSLEQIVQSGNPRIINDLEITASLGLGLFLDAKKASEPTLIKLADTALYSAKNSGRNQLQVNIR